MTPLGGTELQHNFLNNYVDDATIIDELSCFHLYISDDYNGKATLMTGLDTSKDQSYFLYMVGHKELEKSVFPLGKPMNLITQTRSSLRKAM